MILLVNPILNRQEQFRDSQTVCEWMNISVLRYYIFDPGNREEDVAIILRIQCELVENTRCYEVLRGSTRCLSAENNVEMLVNPHMVGRARTEDHKRRTDHVVPMLL